jgi:hypothetical protein
MQYDVLFQLNEAYRHGVYAEETLSEEELADINGWVSSLISEGYDLDDYSDEELYEAYLSALDERLTGLRVRRAVTKFQDQNERPDQYKKPSANKNPRPNYTLGAVATHKEGSPNPYNPSTPEDYKDSGNRPTKRGGRGKKGEPKTGYYGTDKRDSDRGSGNAAKRRADNMEESVDLYDIVSEYLVSEGFCDSYEDADVIMANMSEEWRESILESRGDGESDRFKHKITRSVKKQKGTKTSYDNLGNMVRQPYHAQLKKRKLPPYNY